MEAGGTLRDTSFSMNNMIEKMKVCEVEKSKLIMLRRKDRM